MSANLSDQLSPFRETFNKNNFLPRFFVRIQSSPIIASLTLKYIGFGPEGSSRWRLVCTRGKTGPVILGFIRSYSSITALVC